MADAMQAQTQLREVEERLCSDVDQQFAALEDGLHSIQEMREQMIELHNFVRQLSVRVVDLQAQGRGDQRSADYYTPTRYTKLDFPSFSSEDVDVWMAKCERYFNLDGTPKARKTLLASIALDNNAYKWFQHFEKNQNGVIPWQAFVEAIRVRFGPLYDDPMEDLMHLRQTGSLVDYQQEFDTLMCKIDMSDVKRLSCFVGGLKSALASGVKLLRPQNLSEATKLARLQESNFDSLQQLTVQLSKSIFTPHKGLLPTPN
ncbi:hypothetical protein QN277_022855 [Acacia crassicarpa]|uniref:Retrotransposon gag domain-containing protein n=1 Tax=Acacia crassicarpa TaxID=499986 RepID=A0AAE1MJ61_9FABA|nr:hypothetical protein QN277_022855 [Acacia crassicarpa]